MTYEDIPPKFGEPPTGELLCPNCGSSYLDYERIQIYERDEEDSDVGLHVDVHWKGHPLLDSRPAVTIDGDLQGNPSDRRQGMTLTFRCENCDPLCHLDISQHKGMMYFNWRIEPLTSKPKSA